MRSTSERAVLRRTLARHTTLTALVAVLVSGLVTAGVVLFAQQDAYRSAEQVARQVGSAVIVPLSHHDFAGPIEDPERADLGRDLSPFLSSGMVRRVKVWTGPGDRSRIAFSDERRVEGETGDLAPETIRRIDAGEALVMPVPNDAEHRFEIPEAGALLEVFIAFRDAAGGVSRLEVYVPVDEMGTARHTAATMLPMVLGGLLALAVATLPLSVALARRMERERAEQRAIRHYGLAAAESSRQELARHLHDGVIPDLAGAGMLLEAVRAEESGAGDRSSRELLDHAHDLLTGEVRELRTLLRDLVPPDPVGGDLPAALRELADRLRAPSGDHPVITIEASLDGPVSDEAAVVLHRVAGELLRNAVRHARADQVRVRLSARRDGRIELVVTDDGVGFDPDRSHREGHVGLLLVRRVLDDHSGRLDVTSAPGAGTTMTASVPADVASWPPGPAAPRGGRRRPWWRRPSGLW